MKGYIITSIVLVGMFGCMFSNSISEKHIIPANFKGVVMIIHNQANGIDATKEDGSIVYNIPANGILITKKPLIAGLKDIKYYYQVGNERREIKYCWDCKKINSNNDTVYVFGGSTGTYGQGDVKVDCTTYLVCTQAETDSLSKVLEKIRPIELLKK